MNKYKLPHIIKYCNHIRKMSRIQQSNKTIYEKAKNYNKVNMHDKSPYKKYNNEFQRAEIFCRLGLYGRTSIEDMIDKCCTVHATDEKDSDY